MGYTTDYANEILTNTFSGAYIALATSAPTADTSGSGLAEPSTAAGYARSEASTGKFSAAARKITNYAYIYFPEATDSWGTITHMCVTTAKTGGNLRYFGALKSSVPVPANTVPLFKPQTINISLDAD